MAFYVNQNSKDVALRNLFDYLVDQSNLPRDGNADALQEAKDLTRSKAYDDAAARLQTILDTRVGVDLNEPEPFPPPLRMEFGAEDMCVVVVAPSGTMGVDRTLTFDRHSAEVMPDRDNVDRWTRLVAAILLRDALRQLGA